MVRTRRGALLRGAVTSVMIALALAQPMARAVMLPAHATSASRGSDHASAAAGGSVPSAQPHAVSPAASQAASSPGSPAVSPAGPKGWQPISDGSWPGHGFDLSNPAACDPIDPAQCMLPYPNDWFTRNDPGSATGRRLDLNVLAMPKNVAAKPIEPFEWNRSDGFSAGAQILTVVPGMTSNADLAPSRLPPITDLAMNSDANLGVVVLDTETGATWPVWVEVDQYTQEAGLFSAGTIGSVQQDLMIHPAVNLTDGHRYIVALRHLRLDDGSTARSSSAFAAYRDHKASTHDPRTAHMEGIFSALARVGWARQDLYLAWDFTTASTNNVTGRLVALRDDAFAQLGANPADLAAGKVTGRAPAFSVDSVANYAPAQNANVARQITGHFTVPCYIAPVCAPPIKCATLTSPTPIGAVFDDCPSPGQFALDPTNPDALPHQVLGQTYQANFICIVGRANFQRHALLRPVEYGHGLFGGAGEVNASPQEEMAGQHGMMYCATDWFGFASADIPNAVLAISDVSRFPILTDRVQQGELDFLYLARLMVHPHGFSSSPAFQFADHTSFIDIRAAFYDGNSQGGIYGGTVCAVSVDVRRCALGVPGMDYSILLPRSSDYVATQPLSKLDLTKFDPTNPTGLIGYSNLFDLSYPDQSQRMLILDLIQTLWDRSDPNGYATHITSGLPHTPSHRVLMQMAWGDHQVADITAEDEARTIGAAGLYPPLEGSRLGPYAPSSPYWGIPPITVFPYAGSAITTFDAGPPGSSPFGTDPPPSSDVPNRSGHDPHEAPRRACLAQQQKDAFLSLTGAVINPGAGPPYLAGGWNGSCTLS